MTADRSLPITRRASIVMVGILTGSILAVVPPAKATLPGENGKIAFTSPLSIDSNAADVWTVNPDGSGAVNLTSDSPAGDSGPSWSPDGTKIAYSSGYGYTSTPTDPGPIPQIFVMNADGSGRTQLTVDGENMGIDPAWSPDGTKIAFWGSTADGNGNNVFVMGSDGSNMVQLTTFSGSASPLPPSWSPDGTRITFDKSAEGETYSSDIFIMNADGSSLVDMSSDGVWEDIEPSWSPDGTKIAFSSNREGYGIYLMDPDGTDIVKLTADAFGPAWSPDGSKIAYQCGGICVMDSDGSNASSLMASPSSVGDLDWHAAPAPVDSSTTVRVQVKAKILVTGTVSPAAPSGEVRVTLFRKRNGRFGKVASRLVVLSQASTYSTTFKRPAAGTCKVKAVFTGDESRLQSQASKTFKC